MSKWFQAGFSLIQGLMLSAAVAGMALVGTKMNETHKMSIKDAKTRDSLELIHSMIFSILQNRTHCLATLSATTGGLTVNPSTTRTINNIRMNGSSGATNAFTRTGIYLNNEIQISNMTITFPANLANPANVRITYLRDPGVPGVNKKTFGQKTFIRNIPISLERSNATLVRGCIAVVQSSGSVVGNDDVFQDFCSDFAYTQWDATLQTCVVKQNLCNADEIFAGIDNTGTRICRPLASYIQYIFDTSAGNVLSCPDDFDQINFTFENPANRITFECNKTGETCPSDFQRWWVGVDGVSDCRSNLPRGANGQVENHTDGAPGATGAIRYTCTNGTWIPSNRSCFHPCPAAVPTPQWNTGGGRTCRSNTPIAANAPNGSSYPQTAVPQPGAPGDGSATWTCVDGSWQVTGAVCSVSCLPQTVTWSEPGILGPPHTCSANIASTYSDGAAPVVTNSTAGRTGSNRYLCNGGVWQQHGSYTPRCEPAPLGGQCTWTGELNWEFGGCVGFQMSETPPTVTVPVPVANKAACRARCGGCTTGKTFRNCQYIPNSP